MLYEAVSDVCHHHQMQFAPLSVECLFLGFEEGVVD